MASLRGANPALIVGLALVAFSVFVVAIGLLWQVWCGAAPWLAKSLAIGCALFVLPVLYFTLLAFRYRHDSQAALIAQSFYRGQANRFVLTAVGFALVFEFADPLNVPALFVGFCAMIPAHILVAMFVSKNCSGSGSK